MILSTKVVFLFKLRKCFYENPPKIPEFVYQNPPKIHHCVNDTEKGTKWNNRFSSKVTNFTQNLKKSAHNGTTFKNYSYL